MTETVATYTIDPPALSPMSLEERITVLERATKAIIAGQDKQSDEFEAFRDELRSHVATLDRLSDQLLPFVPTYSEVLTSEQPHMHMRIQITRNTKGYGYESSVSVDANDPDVVRAEVEQLLIDADTIARGEIRRRESLDETPAQTVAKQALTARNGMLGDSSGDDADVAL